MKAMKTFSKSVIYYFSGTGNSKQIAKWFAEFAEQKNVECVIKDIAKFYSSDLNSIDPEPLIIFISPVHGFNFPKITLNFIRRFPPGTNKVVLMNTRAGMKIGPFITPGLTGIAFLLSSLILARKGYKIVGQVPFDMPSNWISIHPALTEKAVKYIHRKNYNLIEKHAHKILTGKKDFLALRDIIQDILIFPISLGYYLLGRYVFAKSFYASYKCDNCGSCIKQCPAKAIVTLKGRPFWTFNCESCMKCMNFCPQKAIETAHGLFILVSLILSSISSLLLISILPQNGVNDLIRFIILNLMLIFLLWILYGAQHFLLGKKNISRIIPFTSLTYYKIWGRYRSKREYL